MRALQPSRSVFEISFPLVVLAVLLVYTVALFLEIPYSGIRWNTSNARISDVFVNPPPEAPLQIGDRLIQVGMSHLADFQADLSMTLFEGLRPGQTISLLIERDGQQLTVPWIYPGFNPAEFWFRLTSQWWIAYIFWMSGTLALLFIRPKDTRWSLLVLFFFLTSIWLIVSSGPSRWHTWGSPIVLRMAVWLSLPVYLHLHWSFPQPLAHLPSRAWVGVYLVGIALSMAELFRLIPQSTYLLGLLLALAGSVVLLLVHFVKGKEQRREVGMLAVLLLIPVVPVITAGVTRTILPLSPGMSASTLLVPLVALPGIPLAYFYAIFRRRLGGMEGRVNRLVVLYIYLALLIVFFLLIRLIATAFIVNLTLEGEFGIFLVLLTGLVTALGFPGFQRWAEQRLLNMPLAPTQLIQTYAARIVTSLDSDHLVSLLRDEVMPSLLVRQAALLKSQNGGGFSPLLVMGLATSDLPAPSDFPDLPPEIEVLGPQHSGRIAPWARLAFPLRAEGRLLGWMMFGRRDPDDFYSASEIPTLQAIVNQTALALMNIEQAEQIHGLYREDMEHQEAEKLRLARVLHDGVLRNLADMVHQYGRAPGDENKLREMYLSGVEQIRNIIYGLRPATLAYGLGPALQELGDNLMDQVGNGSEGGPAINVVLSSNEGFYPQEVELHLFRIVQQACQNALQHAHAGCITITGCLEPGKVDIVVADDGIGFEAGEHLDLPALLARKHYGLAGMFERAALIGAALEIQSQPGRGTQVHLSWQPD